MKVSAVNITNTGRKDLVNGGSNDKFKYVVIALSIIILFILIVLGIITLLKSSNNSDNSNNSKTQSNIPNTSATSSPVVITSSLGNTTRPMSSPSTTLTSPVINPSVSPMQPVTTSGPELSQTPVSTQSIEKDSEYGLSYSYPSNWTSSVSSITKDCQTSSSFLKTFCTGTFNSNLLNLASPDKDTNTKNYYLSFEGPTSNSSTSTCNGNLTSYYAYIKGTRYDIPTCVNAQGEQSGAVDLRIPSFSSKWNSVLLKYNMKDRAMMDQFLDILVSIQ